MRDSNRAAANGPRIGRGTGRTRERVPRRIAQPPGFAGVRISGTVRAERTRPAESPANGFAGRSQCGAVSSFFRNDDGHSNSGPDRGDVDEASSFRRLRSVVILRGCASGWVEVAISTRDVERGRGPRRASDGSLRARLRRRRGREREGPVEIKPSPSYRRRDATNPSQPESAAARATVHSRGMTSDAKVTIDPAARERTSKDRAFSCGLVQPARSDDAVSRRRPWRIEWMC